MSGNITLPYHPNPPQGQSQLIGDGIGRPILFQVTNVSDNSPAWPYALATHVNPSQFSEKFTKSKNVVMTRGGFVEFIWPDNLDSLSADSSTGAFIGPGTGLSSDSANPSAIVNGRLGGLKGRRHTLAWERFADLLDLFRNNGHVYNSNGQPVLRGRVVCMYDRGIYTGYFTSFSVEETGDQPFMFKFDWEFQVLTTDYLFPIQLSPLARSTNRQTANSENPSNADIEALFKPSSGSNIASTSTLDPDVQKAISGQSGGKTVVGG